MPLSDAGVTLRQRCERLFCGTAYLTRVLTGGPFYSGRRVVAPTRAGRLDVGFQMFGKARIPVFAQAVLHAFHPRTEQLRRGRIFPAAAASQAIVVARLEMEIAFDETP